jgi:hypothetical protein
MFNRKALLTLFTAASILGIANYISQSYASQQAKVQTIHVSQNSPDLELTCYPDRYSKPEKLNKFPFDRAVYYEIHARLKNVPQESPFEVLYFRTSLKECKLLNPDSQVGSRLLYVPRAVALHFSKLQFQPPFERCLKQNASAPNPKQRCIKNFEDFINVSQEVTAEGTDFLYPEDVEVLNQMGIRTDRALVITKPSDVEELRRRQLEQKH